MTMLGRFQTQKLLKEMVQEKCEYAIIETSSEGIKQYRHKGIDYDVAVFTNLTPEHLESHGGFENYKKAKGELFRQNKGTFIINADDENAEYFLSFAAEQKTVYSTNPANLVGGAGMGEIIADDLEVSKTGSNFTIFGTDFELNLPGIFNVYNALAAVATVNALGVPLDKCAEALKKINGVPGRMEKIDEGQGFTVMVDYAPEVASVEQLYEAAQDMPHERIIHVLGSCGGGRDKDRQPKLGRIAGENADVVFVTNEDPYDDDPMSIIDAVAGGAVEAGKKDGENLFRILDRKKAIEQAIGMAEMGDLVLITGKGCEQAMCVAGGRKIEWDDREVAREALREMN